MEKQNAPLTIRQAAQEYGFPEHAVRTLVKRGEFPIVQTGNRVYIMRHVFDQYLQTGGAVYRPGAWLHKHAKNSNPGVQDGVRVIAIRRPLA